MTLLAFPSTCETNVDALRLVIRARRTILRELPRRLTFQATADELGVRGIDLEAAFARLHTNARLFMRVARLLKLHEQLRAGQVDSVGSALVRWGFPRCSGQAAADYEFLFRETPEETLSTAACTPFASSSEPEEFDDPAAMIEALARLAGQLPSSGGIRQNTSQSPLPTLISQVSIS